MRSIAKLFGHSPFGPLQSHMAKVAQCVQKINDVVEAVQQGDHARVEKIANEISQLEHEADQLKHDIQQHLTRSYFLPVDRGALQEILAIQDSIADKAENIGVLFTLKPIQMIDALKDDFRAFLDKNLQAFESVRQIIDQLDELVETGFGGGEAEKVLRMVDTVARQEYEADLIQRRLLKAVFAHEDELSMGDFFLWNRLFKQVSELSNLAERLANRVRRTLELKK